MEGACQVLVEEQAIELPQAGGLGPDSLFATRPPVVPFGGGVSLLTNANKKERSPPPPFSRGDGELGVCGLQTVLVKTTGSPPVGQQ